MIFLVIIGIGFGRGYRKNSLFEIIFFPYWGIRFGDDLLFLSFLIDEIWLGLQDNIFYSLIFGRLSKIGPRAKRIGPSFWVGTKKV